MTMTEVYRATVDAPPIAPPRYSLLSVLPTVDEPGARWEGGYTYVSELSGAHGADPAELCAQAVLGTDQVVHDWVNVDALVVWAEAYCRSTLGGLPRDGEALARRKLAAHQSYDLARYLALNVFGPASAADATNVDVGTLDGLGWLEDKLSNRLQGPVGTMWCSLGTLDLLVGSGAVRLDGARYVTAAGTPVAADAGFQDDLGPTGSGGGAGWLLGTGPARVRLGPIEVPNPDQLRQLIDRSTNTVRLQAWRAAAVEIDWGDTTDTWPHPAEGAPYAMAVQVRANPASGTPARTTRTTEKGA